MAYVGSEHRSVSPSRHSPRSSCRPAANIPGGRGDGRPTDGPRCSSRAASAGWRIHRLLERVFADDDPAELDDGPFADYDGPPAEQRGDFLHRFAVPPNEAINVEWVEVKSILPVPPRISNSCGIMLTSPDGTQSELNHYYADPDFISVLASTDFRSRRRHRSGRRYRCRTAARSCGRSARTATGAKAPTPRSSSIR